MGIEDSTGLGYTTQDLQGMFIAGNDFNYVTTHAKAIRTAGDYNIVSSSSVAIEKGDCDLSKYQIIDMILGLEKNDENSLIRYKSFHQSMQERLRDYTACGGNLLVSGVYFGSDMTTDEDKSFLADILKVRFEGTNNELSEKVRGLGINFNFYRQLKEKHYAAPQSAILLPSCEKAFPTMIYDNETCAAVAYQGSDFHTFTMGFPFECIIDKQQRESIMRGILKFLINR
jgi:hypothetical protein